MSSASIDDESCVSGGSKDDIDYNLETRSSPLKCISDERFQSSDARQSRIRHHHQQHGNSKPATVSSKASSSSQRQQQQQQQQTPLSPRSREYLRLRVNARERQRMHDMNVALDALRRAMPYAQGPAVKKLSKMNTLLLARNYILLLTRTLDELRRLLVASQVLNPSAATDAMGRPSVIGAAIGGQGRARGMAAMDHHSRLEAALRGLIDGREINAEQQRYAEELIRREQLQLRQEQEQALMTSGTKASRKNDATHRNRNSQETDGCRRKSEAELSPPEVQRNSRKRKLERSESPESPSTSIARGSPVMEEKDVVASSTDETGSRAGGHKGSFPDERLMQYAIPPLQPPTTSGPLMMMTPSRLPEMAAVGFTPAAAHQALGSGTATAAAAAAAMMGHMISGPFPSCPCPHCADSRPTYIMPIDLITAAAASHYQQHRL